jgi:phosphonopyruvate decarboxylase
VIDAAEFANAAHESGFDWYAGVPCSFLTPFINYVIGDPGLSYVSAANEGDAVATAAGAVIGGHRGVAIMQNSGLGNAVSPLTSLAYVFRIPMLIICTHRGAPGLSDEPQHELMGQITGALFKTMAIPWESFPDQSALIEPVLARANDYLDRESRPYALLMHKGSVAAHPLADQTAAPRACATAIVGDPLSSHGLAGRPSRALVLARIIEATPVSDSVVIATTGYTGRELYAIADRDNHLYMVGSMGCASALGLGLAMARPDRHVVVIDGDGAALMRMGNFATLGAYAPANLTHIVLDNEAHDSTGAQATVSAGVDFASIAAACGYASVHRGADLASLTEFLRTGATSGPRFLHLKIKTGTIDKLPRPCLPPHEALQRLIRRLHIK